MGNKDARTWAIVHFLVSYNYDVLVLYIYTIAKLHSVYGILDMEQLFGFPEFYPRNSARE